MFIRVQVTFVRNFIFYVPLLAAFGVSFGLVFGPSSDFSARRVFLKVVAMLIGEIDYGEIDTDFSNTFAFVCKLLLLLGFILAFSVTLMNLLNGLAVTDIRAGLQKVISMAVESVQLFKFLSLTTLKKRISKVLLQIVLPFATQHQGDPQEVCPPQPPSPSGSLCNDEASQWQRSCPLQDV